MLTVDCLARLCVRSHRAPSLSSLSTRWSKLTGHSQLSACLSPTPAARTQQPQPPVLRCSHRQRLQPPDKAQDTCVGDLQLC